MTRSYKHLAPPEQKPYRRELLSIGASLRLSPGPGSVLFPRFIEDH